MYQIDMVQFLICVKEKLYHASNANINICTCTCIYMYMYIEYTCSISRNMHVMQYILIFQGTASYTNEDIDMYVQHITENGASGGNSTNVCHPSSNSSSNGLFTPPSSVTMLGVCYLIVHILHCHLCIGMCVIFNQVPSPTFQLKEEIHSPPSGPPPYGTSPATSTHSPRISPEPSVLGSYPPSVQQANVITGSERVSNGNNWVTLYVILF